MLNDRAIDKLITPVISRQEYINVFVLESIATKVKDIGKLTPGDVKQLKMLVNMGADIREMNKELARLSNLQVKDIKSIIKTVAIDAHLDAKPLYDYRHKKFIPYEKNKRLQNIVKAVNKITAGTYRNISNSRAVGFLIRDLKHPNTLKFQSIEDTYQSVVDEAIQAVKSGVDYRVAIRRTLKQLSDSGIRRLSWESGYTQRLDTAVRRNVLEGVRAINQEVENTVGKELNADGIELSAHINCAVDHEPFQGHIFTTEEFERLQSNLDFTDIDGQTFAAVDRVIGQYNCRHVARSMILGVSKPRYTKQQLEKIIQDNHEGYELNGKHLTMYECTQLQRKLETRIRYAKDEQIIMQSAGNMDAARLARKKVINLTREYTMFSKDCGLSIKKDRIEVAGYRPIKQNK